MKITKNIKNPETATLPGLKGCKKRHLVLDLIEKEFTKYFYYIIIIFPTF